MSLEKITEEVAAKKLAEVMTDENTVYAAPIAFVLDRMIRDRDVFDSVIDSEDGQWEKIYNFASMCAASILAVCGKDTSAMMDYVVMFMAYSYATGKLGKELVDEETEALFNTLEERAESIMVSIMEKAMLTALTNRNSAVQ